VTSPSNPRQLPRTGPSVPEKTPPASGSQSPPQPPADDPGTVVDQDAYQFLLGMLRQWGIESLAPTVLDFLQQGYSTEAIPILLQDTDTYKARFIGNEERRKLGMPVLSPAEYLSAEQSYRNIMQASGLPVGFYDQPSDFAGFIGRDVSPLEMQRRVDAAVTASNNLDQRWLDQFKQFYNVGQGELAAYLLDPERGMDAINKAVRGTTIAAAAGARGVGLDQQTAERYGAAAGQNYQAQAQQFAEYADRGSFFAQLYGQNYNSETAAEQVFSGSQEAQDTLRRLAKKEQAEFAGAGGPSAAGLTTKAQY